MALGQAKFDTLFIGKFKFPLEKVKLYHPYQAGPINLPSEYKDLGDYMNLSKELSFKYKYDNDTTIGVNIDDDGNEIITSRWECSYNSSQVKTYYLSCFVDTIHVKLADFSKQSLYIKSNNKRMYIASAKIDAVKNDTIRELQYFNSKDGKVFSYWNSTFFTESERTAMKLSKYILRDFYYRKGEATYYLNRKFVIIIN